MIEFDFIIDDRFREALTKDYSEFQSSLAGQAWKASLVLVGSIVEALLVDHLLATKHQSKTGIDPLKMSLADLISACEKDGAISPNTASLSTVIREYRNLIHPGRTVRLGQTANKSAAIVAGELLQLIVDEISVKKRAQFGYTAEQIVKKLERDESAISIHTHLLKEMSEHEIERLLLKTIPKRYFDLDSIVDFGPGTDFEGQARLATCFRSAFALAPEETKKRVTLNFLSILKEEDQYKVFAYETAFFRAHDLKYLSAPQGKLVKAHLLSRIQKDISTELVVAIGGLPAYLEAGEISDLVDALLKACLPKSPSPLKASARKYLSTLWLELPSGNDGIDHKVLDRLDDWIRHFEDRGNLESAATVREIKDELSDIPF